MTITITGFTVRDIRTPTSRTLAGSDAVHTDPDYSAAYVVLHTDAPDGIEGHGITFTLGRGTELCVAGVRALAPLIVGQTLESLTSDMAAFWRVLTNESQLRWLGPEKGAVHLATAAIVNAVWDLWAKSAGKPVWRLVAEMTPEEFVGCIDFRYLTDAITREEALAILRRLEPTRAERIAHVTREGYPAYITSAGWMGYPDDQVRALCREALAEGWTRFKIKVGRDAEENVRRCALVREEIGPDGWLMVDANQVWDVGEAIEHVRGMAQFGVHWVEEPTSPDDIVGHAAIRKAIAPVPVATGEHAANRVIFKQLMQAGAIDFAQFDNCRLGGLSEGLAVLLLATKFGVPVCPHAGGLGLCEYVQHISLIDYVCVSGSLERRAI
jgi:L-fuconate dehydratase